MCAGVCVCVCVCVQVCVCVCVCVCDHESVTVDRTNERLPRHPVVERVVCC